MMTWERGLCRTIGRQKATTRRSVSKDMLLALTVCATNFFCFADDIAPKKEDKSIACAAKKRKTSPKTDIIIVESADTFSYPVLTC